MGLGPIVFLAVAIGIAGCIVSAYSGLVQLRVRAESSWSDGDMQLKRRQYLIPNVVKTVQGYVAHERGTFENLAKFRSAAMDATTAAERAAAERQLTSALKSLFAVAENYPQLRASEEFWLAQASIQDVENNIQEARRCYNAIVRNYNRKLQSFPTNILGNSFGFQPKELFQVDTFAGKGGGCGQTLRQDSGSQASGIGAAVSAQQRDRTL